MIVEFFGLSLVLRREERMQEFVSCTAPDGRRMPAPKAIWADGWCNVRPNKADGEDRKREVFLVAEGDGLMDLVRKEVLYVIIRKVYKNPVLHEMNERTGELTPVLCPITGKAASTRMHFGSGIQIPISEEINNAINEMG